MRKQTGAGIVCCSNAMAKEKQGQVEKLCQVLSEMGITPYLSEYIYEKDGVFAGTGEERAEALMNFYRDDRIDMILDISGGDIANEVLCWLDFDVICSSKAVFWGYSDLTTILNALYTKTGRSNVLYQARNLVGDCGDIQKGRFLEYLHREPEKTELFSPEVTFLQGNEMDGILVGGNIRCFLKLAGTPYWPDLKDKILLLEAWGGEVPQMTTFLSQLKQIGAFEQVKGILLGTFTKMEATNAMPTMPELVRRFAGDRVPVAYTREIGHGKNSKALLIGERLTLRKNFDIKDDTIIR